jgi:pimeloyl-ACP methyl ester carboxylesterase/DNA-binding winged helix-turn-helix (wHTH) protein
MLFLFEDFTLDVDRRELRRGPNAIAVEPQVFDLLVCLIRNRDRVVSRDDLIASVWGGRIVSESTLASRINAARAAIGDSGEAQRLIKTIQRKGIRFVGDVQPGTASDTTPQGRPPVQDVTFCRTADQVHLAVATTGNGLPVVKTANWLNHIEYDWQSPVWSPLISHLSQRFRLIRYDERGNGLSDWNVAELSFEAFVRDLEAVVDSLNLARFALLGVSQGAAVSIAYATRHPERVSRLVLCGGYVLGHRKRADAHEIAQREALEQLIKLGWGQDNPAFRQVFTSLFIPGGTPEQMQWWNELQKISTSPENAIRLSAAFGEIDVSKELSQVNVPTLVMHSRGDARVPFDQGLRLAREIPGARFVALESDNHIILSHEPAWQRYMSEMTAFLAQDGEDTHPLQAPAAG